MNARASATHSLYDPVARRPEGAAVSTSASLEEIQMIRSSSVRLQREFDGIFGAETIE